VATTAPDNGNGLSKTVLAAVTGPRTFMTSLQVFVSVSPTYGEGTLWKILMDIKKAFINNNVPGIPNYRCTNSVHTIRAIPGKLEYRQ
jgi:hypothetical protein